MKSGHAYDSIVYSLTRSDYIKFSLAIYYWYVRFVFYYTHIIWQTNTIIMFIDIPLDDNIVVKSCWPSIQSLKHLNRTKRIRHNFWKLQWMRFFLLFIFKSNVSPSKLPMNYRALWYQAVADGNKIRDTMRFWSSVCCLLENFYHWSSMDSVFFFLYPSTTS